MNLAVSFGEAAVVGGNPTLLFGEGAVGWHPLLHIAGVLWLVQSLGVQGGRPPSLHGLLGPYPPLAFWAVRSGAGLTFPKRSGLMEGHHGPYARQDQLWW